MKIFKSSFSNKKKLESSLAIVIGKVNNLTKKNYAKTPSKMQAKTNLL